VETLLGAGGHLADLGDPQVQPDGLQEALDRLVLLGPLSLLGGHGGVAVGRAALGGGGRVGVGLGLPVECVLRQLSVEIGVGLLLRGAPPPSLGGPLGLDVVTVPVKELLLVLDDVLGFGPAPPGMDPQQLEDPSHLRV
jgi:hypothetical protein